MLSKLIGEVDINSAFVLGVMFITVCIVITSLIVKRRSRVDVNNEFELAKMQKDMEDKRLMYQLETERGYKFKQLEQNLITSHKVEPNNNFQDE